MGYSVFSGTALEHALRDGSLDRREASRTSAVLVGMVKASEREGHVAFTSAGCGSWAEVPVDLVEAAEVIGRRGCQGHEHPVARITFKVPESPHARLFAALLSQAQQTSVPELLMLAKREN